jgi:hypothetical protein
MKVGADEEIIYGYNFPFVIFFRNEIVLSAFSPVLKEMINKTQKEIAEKQQFLQNENSSIQIKLPNLNAKIMKVILSLLHSKEDQIRIEDITQIIYVADKLQILFIRDKILKFINEILSNENPVHETLSFVFAIIFINLISCFRH